MDAARHRQEKREAAKVVVVHRSVKPAASDTSWSSRRAEAIPDGHEMDRDRRGA